MNNNQTIPGESQEASQMKNERVNEVRDQHDPAVQVQRNQRRPHELTDEEILASLIAPCCGVVIF